ncbi:STAS domain-containing protein [Shouchella shacheensis]|uniref:STAS domain-containing protein n=1 Tax=Shouchella shacheensis TaxID=1649580 RepID=UPI000740522C|nr:STAS domain-containing protein [Shouchella shacheensis]
MNLSIRSEQTGNVHHIDLAGEIDAYTVPQLREAVMPLAKEADTTIVVNFENVEYIDSTGLGTFVGILKATDAHGSELTLKGMSDRIKRLFSITGLDEVINIKEGQS